MSISIPSTNNENVRVYHRNVVKSRKLPLWTSVSSVVNRFPRFLPQLVDNAPDKPLFRPENYPLGPFCAIVISFGNPRMEQCRLTRNQRIMGPSLTAPRRFYVGSFKAQQTDGS
jgi:hypothetical protein